MTKLHTSKANYELCRHEHFTDGSVDVCAGLFFSRKGGGNIETKLRELRNSRHKLLCMVNDCTGKVETEGPHHSSYIFIIPVGGTFTVIRDNLISLITRTATEFTVADNELAA